MAAKVQGTAHLYGVGGAITGVTVNSFRDREAPANTGQVENEIGNVIERRYDDTTNEGQIEVTLRSGYTIPSSKGTLLTYDGTDWEIQSVEKNSVKKGYRTLVLNVKKSELVTPA